jgi:hypothetical protein
LALEEVLATTAIIPFLRQLPQQAGVEAGEPLIQPEVVVAVAGEGVAPPPPALAALAIPHLYHLVRATMEVMAVIYLQGTAAAAAAGLAKSGLTH